MIKSMIGLPQTTVVCKAKPNRRIKSQNALTRPFLLAASTHARSKGKKRTPVVFVVHDALMKNGPINHLTKPNSSTTRTHAHRYRESCQN